MSFLSNSSLDLQDVQLMSVRGVFFQSVGHNDAIEDELFNFAKTAEFEALSSEVRSLTKELLAEGYNRTRLLDAYELAISCLYGEDLDEQADELLEVMTELEGWCSPRAQL